LERLGKKRMRSLLGGWTRRIQKKEEKEGGYTNEGIRGQQTVDSQNGGMGSSQGSTNASSINRIAQKDTWRKRLEYGESDSEKALPRKAHSKKRKHDWAVSKQEPGRSSASKKGGSCHTNHKEGEERVVQHRQAR